MRLSNRLRELFTRRGRVHMVYFDATVPGFKPGKHRMKKGPFDPTGMSAPTAAGPRGVAISAPWAFGAPVRGPDGALRVPLDYVAPGGTAWIDVEGEPRVRVSPQPWWTPQGPTVIDPALPAVDVDTYLADAAARIARDAE